MCLFVLKSERKITNLEKAKDKEFLDKWNLDINLVKEHEDDIKIASLYKFSLIDDKNEVLSQDEKRKKIENESIFDNMQKKNGNSSTRSLSVSSSIKINKVDHLRKKLKKSIEEKKLNEIYNGNDAIKKDCKSLLFNIKKINNGTESVENKSSTQSKLLNLVNFNKQNNKSEVSNEVDNCSKVTLVSNDYGDDSNDSNI